MRDLLIACAILLRQKKDMTMRRSALFVVDGVGRSTEPFEGTANLLSFFSTPGSIA